MEIIRGVVDDPPMFPTNSGTKRCVFHLRLAPVGSDGIRKGVMLRVVAEGTVNNDTPLDTIRKGDRITVTGKTEKEIPSQLHSPFFRFAATGIFKSAVASPEPPAPAVAVPATPAPNDDILFC